MGKYFIYVDKIDICYSYRFSIKFSTRELFLPDIHGGRNIFASPLQFEIFSQNLKQIRFHFPITGISNSSTNRSYNSRNWKLDTIWWLFKWPVKYSRFYKFDLSKLVSKLFSLLICTSDSNINKMYSGRSYCTIVVRELVLGELISARLIFSSVVNFIDQDPQY